VSIITIVISQALNNSY